MGKATTTTSSRRSIRLAQRSSSSARTSDDDDSTLKPSPPNSSAVVVSSDDNAAGPSANKRNSKESEDNDIDCSVCLLGAVHPVKLPCGHIFCYLCIKGVMQSTMSGTCALCRAPVPRNFLFNPELVEPPPSSQSEEEEEEWRWFYEGRGGGWWQYDERTSTDIEHAFLKRQQRQDNDKDDEDEDGEDDDELELLIAGFIYVIDLNAMVQKRKCAPQIQRMIKRDRNIPDKKGVAGISRKKRNKRTNRLQLADGTSV